ncbi:MAG: outer membrane protein assembly factor BamA [bacterium TMED6]|nr:MAG: outer membrane protein assembly factor BamA [bacterium TMED6]
MKISSFILLIFFSFSLSQNNELKISDITVVGNVNMKKNDIINFSGLSSDSYVNAIEIQNAINRLWLLNKFRNIQVDLEETSYGITNLIITVEEFPKLNKIIFKGQYFNFELFKFKKSKSELTKISKLEPGISLTDQKINQAINLLNENFIERNFHDIEISYKLVDLDGDKLEKNILFNINSGKKSRIHDIKIFVDNKELNNLNIEDLIKSRLNRNVDINKNNILKNLADIDIWKWYTPWKGKYNTNKLDQMISSLTQYYNYNGYLDFDIESYKFIKSKNIFNKSKKVLVININPGNKYYIDKINFTGNYIFTDSLLKSRYTISPGDVFDGIKFDISNMSINNLYRDKGYLFSQINPSVIPKNDSLLNINININEKSIVHVNRVIIKGNENTKDNVIRRDIDVVPGEIFSQSAIMESYRKLFMLNFFEAVTPDIVPIEGKNEVDVIFEVIEKGSGQLNFSAGYSGLLGFTGGGGFSFPNFVGTGQSLSFNYQRGISNQQQSNIPINSSNTSANQQFSMSYVEPRLFNTHNLVGFSANYQERGQSNSQPFDSKITGVGIRFGRRFEWPDKYFKGSWNLNSSKREYYSSNRDDLISYYSSSIDNYIENNNGNYVFPTSGLKVTQSISRDNRNHPEFPTQGSQFNWNFTISGTFLGGSEDYLKNEVGFKWYNQIIDKLVLHQQFKGGLLNPIESSGRSIVPYSARFRMGGALPYGEMLRGYGDNMIGPIGASYPKGGNIMLKYSLELRYLVSETPNMYILCFAEAGNIWDELNMVDPFNLRRSVGVGARVMMPMLGILGYDIAYGFDSSVEEFLTGNNGAHGWEYHFIFGMPIN